MPPEILQSNQSNQSDQNWAIILAAGASQRMGTCKAGLPWGENRTLLTYQIEQFLMAGIRAIVVLRPHNANLIANSSELLRSGQTTLAALERGNQTPLNHLERENQPPPAPLERGEYEVRAIVNPAPELGKTSSILLGLSQLPANFATVIISAVDQPRPAQIYQDLLHLAQQQPNPLIAPSYQGKMGHPILFSQRLLPELLMISEANLGLRQVIQKYRSHISYLEASEIVLTDLNTPAAYQTALKKLLTKGNL